MSQLRWICKDSQELECDLFNYTFGHFSTTGEIQVDQPTLIECVRFRGRERRINISQEIGTKYTTFGTLLLEERTGERVSALAHKHMSDCEQICLEILKEWFAGRGKQPVTWNTLIEVLHDIELCTLAREIAAVKFPEGNKDTPTYTEGSDQRQEEEIPTGIVEDFRHENSEESVRANVNTYPELGLKVNVADTNDSEVHEQEQKVQANDASGEIGRTKDRASGASGEISRTKDQANDAPGEIGSTEKSLILIEDESLD